MEDILQEIEVIQSIYSKEKEVVVEKQGSDSVILAVSFHSPGSQIEIILTVTITSKEYPSSAPHISIKSPHMTRKKCDNLKSALNTRLEELIGEPMLFQLISAYYELASEFSISNVLRDDNALEDIHIVTCLLQLDHMRNKVHYCKAICRLVAKLHLSGRLIFCGRVVLILLQGPSKDIKEYIRLNRSQCVDVDSKGKPCKERLLSVLTETGAFDKVYYDFTTYNFSSLDLLKAKLIEDHLPNLSYDLETLLKK